MPIMYVCEPCQENVPEHCGHFDRSELAVMSDGTWICQDCYDNAMPGDAPSFSDQPNPPEYAPMDMIDPPE